MTGSPGATPLQEPLQDPPPPAAAASAPVDTAPGTEAPACPDEPAYLRVPWSVLDDYHCFGCSPHNPRGLGLRFTAHDAGIATTFRLDRGHESYPGVVHGGIVSVICDETMGNLIVLRLGRTAFTTGMRLRYLEPLRVGVEYTCVARLRPTGGRGQAARPDGAAAGAEGGVLQAEAEILDAAGALLATATASYLPTPIEVARERFALRPDEADRVAAALGAVASHAAAPAASRAAIAPRAVAHQEDVPHQDVPQQAVPQRAVAPAAVTDHHREH
ncbi:PaaI family thioesterase [Pseudofrankia sp. BMG5.37]|uniref:PaaI family thioesterase n=1 Tax=Pseudofrankia sp. BMG5.37 TaxID=3050035 RepID=UPI002893EC54|nr:PaaI family thioesterase [Pseudofrankia sp. BMG5.37]MDT3439052.1 PaaI family thioesterase [Pseudofrankia sp. BMG5.37]